MRKRNRNFLFLLILTLLPLNACHTEEGPDFRLATFQCDVTPPLGTPIYSGYEPLSEIEHPLLAKGIVLEEAGQRYVLCVLDWCEICNATHQLFRETLAEAAGTDPDHVAVHTVHQHTAPMGDADAMRLLDTIDNPPPHPDPEVIEKAAFNLGEELRKSLADLQVVDSIGTGQARVEEIAATRRVKAEDGSIITRWSSCTDPELRAKPEGLIDPYLKTLTFARGDSPLARLHYYTTHPQSFYGDPRASYDFPGMARQELEQQEEVFQIYFTGCAGDVTAGKYNDRTPEARDRLAARLLTGMRESVAATEYEPIQSLAWKTFPVILPMRNDPGFTAEDARAEMMNQDAVHSARLSGAMSLVSMERTDTPFVLSSLRINDVFILHLPGECMVDYQLLSQEQRPDAFVAVAAYGDCGPGYICTDEAFTEGGYEPTATRLAPGAEAILKKGIRQLLAGD
jgi:hypothetical protein